MEEAGQGDNLAQEREAYFRQLREWLEETRRWNQHNLQRHNEYLEYIQRTSSNSNGTTLRRRIPSQQQQSVPGTQGVV